MKCQSPGFWHPNNLYLLGDWVQIIESPQLFPVTSHRQPSAILGKQTSRFFLWTGWEWCVRFLAGVLVLADASCVCCSKRVCPVTHSSALSPLPWRCSGSDKCSDSGAAAQQCSERCCVSYWFWYPHLGWSGMMKHNWSLLHVWDTSSFMWSVKQACCQWAARNPIVCVTPWVSHSLTL